MGIAYIHYGHRFAVYWDSHVSSQHPRRQTIDITWFIKRDYYIFSSAKL